MSNIFKVRQYLGKRGRPKDVEIHGATKKETEPTIVGAAPISTSEPKILDRTTKG